MSYNIQSQNSFIDDVIIHPEKPPKSTKKIY